MSNYSTFTLKPTYNYYTHVASASEAFTNYPSLCTVVAVNPANPNQIGIWSKDGGIFNPTWLTNFQPGSTYSVKIAPGNPNASIVRKGSNPGVLNRTIVGPFAYISVPQNSLPYSLAGVPFRNNSNFSRSGIPQSQWGPVKAIFTVSIASATGKVPNQTYDVWSRDSSDTFSAFTTLIPGSAYYLDMSDYPGQSFTINFTRRASYLITEQADFIVTNNGQYITV